MLGGCGGLLWRSVWSRAELGKGWDLEERCIPDFCVKVV